MFYRSSLALEKQAVPTPLSNVVTPGTGLSVFGATQGFRRRGDEQLLRIDEIGPPGARLALDALAEPEEATEWSVWGPVPGMSRSRAMNVKALVVHANNDTERRDALKSLHAEGEVEQKRGHPWENMIRRGTMGVGKPWMWFSGGQMMGLFRKHTQTLGEHAAIIERRRVRFGGRRFDIPWQLWPLVPTWFKLPDQDNPNHFEIVTGIAGDKIRDRDMHYYRNPRMSNPYDRGAGAMQSLSDDLELDENRAIYLNAIQKSVGQTRQLLVIPGAGGTKTEDALQLALETTRGAERASRLTTIFPPDGDIAGKIQHIKLGESPADMQTEEGRALGRDTMLRANRVSPGAVGVFENVNRANAQVAREDLRASITFNLESVRLFNQSRYFEPLGDQPAEYAGEDRFFCMWHLDPLRDSETARVLMTRVPSMFNQEQMWKVSGFPGGDSTKMGPVATTRMDPVRPEDPERTDT